MRIQTELNKKNSWNAELLLENQCFKNDINNLKNENANIIKDFEISIINSKNDLKTYLKQINDLESELVNHKSDHVKLEDSSNKSFNNSINFN